MKRALLLLLMGCGKDAVCEEAALGPLDHPRVAVVTSDYTSSAIAIVDVDHALTTEAWLDSGTLAPGISASLSGDVVLPSSIVAPGELVLVDRLGVDVVTRIALDTGALIAQIPTQLRGEGESGYRSNPHDVLAWTAQQWLVSRFEPNLDPAAAEIDRGDDLILVDLASRAIAARISLEDAVAEEDGEVIHARPDRLARLGDRVLVGLGRLDSSFMHAGRGAVALVDVDRGRAEVTWLEGMRSCGFVTLTDEGAIALCAGATFESARGRRESAGLVHLAREGDALVVLSTYRASDHPEAPVPSGGAVWLGDARVLAIALGDAATKDRAVLFDLARGTASIVHEAEAFSLGAPLLVDGEVLIPAGEAGVLRFDEVTLDPLGAIDTSPCRHLAARELALLPD